MTIWNKCYYLWWLVEFLICCVWSHSMFLIILQYITLLVLCWFFYVDAATLTILVSKYYISDDLKNISINNGFKDFLPVVVCCGVLWCISVCGIFSVFHQWTCSLNSVSVSTLVFSSYIPMFKYFLDSILILIDAARKRKINLKNDFILRNIITTK